MANYIEKVRFPEVDRPNFNAPLLRVTIVAFVITAAIMCSVIPFKNTFMRDLLIGRDEIAIDRVLFQGLTIFMWAMSFGTVLVKKRRLRDEIRALKEDLLPNSVEIGDERALVRAFEQLTQRADFARSVVVSRFARVLSAWINTRDFDRTVQLMKEESELDIFLSDASFRANRLYIWAMPLLGFVGTVYGVSYGIGGFAEFLKGQVTGEQIKEQVGIITEGLAVAFYTTLVGLLTAGAAAFPSLGAERREESLLGEIDEMLEEKLISRLPSLRKQEFPIDHIRAVRAAVESINTGMTESLTALGKAIVEGFARMPSPQVYERVFAQAIASAGGLISEQYHQLATQYEQRIAALGDQLTQRLDRVADTIGRSGEQQTALQQQSFAELRTGLDALRDAAREIRAGADHASGRISESLTRVTETGARIEQLLRTTQAMETAVASLAGADSFRASMDALRSHLAATDAAIQRLSRPRKVIFEETIQPR